MNRIAMICCAGLAIAMSQAAQAEEAKRMTSFLVLEKKTEGRAIPPNTYTRLEITSEPQGLADPLGYEKRNLLLRIGIGKNYRFNTTLRADAGVFQDTIPLLSREYESSSKAGEAFDRAIGYDRFEFPYFLASTDSGSRVARFEIAADMAETTNSQLSSMSLSFVRRALQSVAPTAGILTSLTKESAEDVASKIDEQASKIFGTSVAEKISFDISLDTATSYDLKILGPIEELEELGADQRLGRWTIRLAPPKPSIFSNRFCNPTCDWKGAYDEATANPSTVLAFRLVERVGDLGSIKAFLLQQEWWNETVSDLDDAAPDDADFGRFCRRIRGAITNLGLNDLDGTIVAYAVSQSELVSEAIKQGMEDAADCRYTAA